MQRTEVDIVDFTRRVDARGPDRHVHLAHLVTQPGHAAGQRKPLAGDVEVRVLGAGRHEGEFYLGELR